MMFWPEGGRVYLYLTPVDFRKSIDGLSVVVQTELGRSPSNGDVYLFRSKKRDKLKALVYSHNSYTLWYRRCEVGKFIFPGETSGQIELDAAYQQWLLSSHYYQQLPDMKAQQHEHFY